MATAVYPQAALWLCLSWLQAFLSGLFLLAAAGYLASALATLKLIESRGQRDKACYLLTGVASHPSDGDF